MIYQFQNSKTGEIIDVQMPMKEYKHYKGVNGDEDFWNRIYYSNQVNIGNAKSDPFNQSSFIEKTGKMKGTYGDLLDYSKELSDKRASQMGVDPLKKKYLDDYKKKRGGKKHLSELKTKIETKNAIIDFTQ